MGRKTKWFVQAAVLGIVSAIFVVPWVQGQVYGTFDLAHITIPIEDLYARYQRAGNIPVWTPEFQGGFPMMANGFQSFFYPPHMIMRSFLPGVWVANISLLLHTYLAAMGMWLLARTARLQLWPTAAAMLLFAGGGYFIGHITLPHLFFPAAWLPLILWSHVNFWVSPTWRRAVLVAALVAAQVFAGHVQMFLYAALMLAVAGLTLALFHLDRRHGWALTIPAVVLILTAVHVLPIQELLPLSKRGEAVTQEEAFSISYPVWQTLTWVRADIFGTGDTYAGAKNEPELLLFFGVGGITLGLIGVWTAVTHRHPLAAVALALVAVGWLLGSGEYSLLYRWLHSLPTFLQGIANPGRAMVLVHLGWSMLVGFGAEVLLVSTRRTRLWQLAAAVAVAAAVGWLIWRQLPETVEAVARQHIAWWLIGVVVLLLAIMLLPRVWRSSVLVIIVAVELVAGVWGINPRVPAQALTGPPRLASTIARTSAAPRVFSHTRLEPVPPPSYELSIGWRVDTVRSVQQTLVPQRNGWRGLRLGLTWRDEERQAAEVWVRVRDSAGRLLRAVPISGDRLRPDEFTEVLFESLGDSAGATYVVAVSSTAKGSPQPHVLIYANIGGDFNPTGELAECVRGICTTVRAPEAAAAADAALTLIYDDQPTVPEREALVPIFGEGFGYWMVRGHMQLQLKRVHRYMYELGERDDFFPENVARNRTLLDRFSVGRVVALWPEHRSLYGMDSMRLVGAVPVGEEYAQAYDNELAWPRVHLARDIRTADDPDEARQMLVDGQVPPTAVVVVGSVPADVGRAPAEATLVQDEPSQMRVRVSGSSSQLLVVRDVVFPGWQAAIDSRPTDILTVDSLFRGVIVPAGEHEVSFVYKPLPYRVGALLSGIGWLVVVGLGFPPSSWKKRR